MNNKMDFSQLFNKIDELFATESIIIAIDGGSASGKTTLAKILSEKYDCNIYLLRRELSCGNGKSDW